jgi:hypothetical protein
LAPRPGGAPDRLDRHRSKVVALGWVGPSSGEKPPNLVRPGAFSRLDVERVRRGTTLRQTSGPSSLVAMRLAQV